MKETISVTSIFGAGIIHTYTLFTILAIIFAIVVSLILLKKNKMINRKSLTLFCIMILLVPAGARLLYILTHMGYYNLNKKKMWEMSLGGFSLMGGLLLATGGGYVYAKVAKIDFWRLSDLLAPGLALGVAIIRIGCFFNGCCFGIKSALPWAVSFPFNSPAYKFYLANAIQTDKFSLATLIRSPSLHPTQLYEAAGALISSVFALVLIRKRIAPGIAALSAAFFFCLIRLLNHFMRSNIQMDENPFWFYPAIYVLVLIGILLMIRNRFSVKK